MKRYVAIALCVLACALLVYPVNANASSEDPREVSSPTDVEVECATSKGPIRVMVKPSWSERGARRFLELVDDPEYLHDVPLFRCIKGFLCQFGYKSPPLSRWDGKRIRDDAPRPELRRFRRGYVSFAGNGRNSRSSHLFVTLGDDVDSLGTESWETPIGFVTQTSMDQVAASWHTGYGDMPPWGPGPDPQRIQRDGRAYLEEFPLLDYIRGCARVPAKPSGKDET